MKRNCTLMYVYRPCTDEEHFDFLSCESITEAKREARGYEAWKIVDEQGMCLYSKKQNVWNGAYARYLRKTQQ